MEEQYSVGSVWYVAKRGDIFDGLRVKVTRVYRSNSDKLLVNITVTSGSLQGQDFVGWGLENLVYPTGLEALAGAAE
jgi:hypothetical protein